MSGLALATLVGGALQVLISSGAPLSTENVGFWKSLGFEVLHAYGTTESYGPSTTCVHPIEWDGLEAGARYGLMARQGVPMPLVDEMIVADPETREPVPMDGETMGEIMLAGNTLMKGYLKNQAATDEAFKEKDPAADSRC